MSGFDNYDQWKTASPYDDDADDSVCYVCNKPLPGYPDIKEDTVQWEGFCSVRCFEYETGQTWIDL